MFSLDDAITCTGTRITGIAHLSLEPEQEPGHGGVRDGLNAGGINHTHFVNHRQALRFVDLRL